MLENKDRQNRILSCDLIFNQFYYLHTSLFLLKLQVCYETPQEQVVLEE